MKLLIDYAALRQHMAERMQVLVDGKGGGSLGVGPMQEVQTKPVMAH